MGAMMKAAVVRSFREPLLVEEIPVGVQQRVEILKALYREAEILILDEPTAVLTPQETEELFNVMRSLREGAGIKLDDFRETLRSLE